jgi:polyisoprenoid-binding protein YceI
MSVPRLSLRSEHRVPRPVAAAAFGALLACGAPTLEAAAWRASRPDVRVVCPMHPGGAFEARTAALSGSLTPGSGKPVALAGEIAVDLATLVTGIELRDRHLRENYLEVQKGAGFDKAVLSELRLNDADGEAFRGRTGFTGTLTLHGVTRSVAGTAEIRAEGAGVRVEANFPLSLSDFGIAAPMYMGVGVANRVLLRVSFSAAPGAGSGR